jgi:hypothetical protein
MTDGIHLCFLALVIRLRILAFVFACLRLCILALAAARISWHMYRSYSVLP